MSSENIGEKHPEVYQLGNYPISVACLEINKRLNPAGNLNCPIKGCVSSVEGFGFPEILPKAVADYLLTALTAEEEECLIRCRELWPEALREVPGRLMFLDVGYAKWQYMMYPVAGINSLCDRFLYELKLVKYAIEEDKLEGYMEEAEEVKKRSKGVAKRTRGILKKDLQGEVKKESEEYKEAHRQWKEAVRQRNEIVGQWNDYVKACRDRMRSLRE